MDALFCQRRKIYRYVSVQNINWSLVKFLEPVVHVKKEVVFFVKSKFKQLEDALPIVHLKQLQQDALPIVHHLVQQALYLPIVFAGHLCHC